jgi:hypothetical protein
MERFSEWKCQFSSMSRNWKMSSSNFSIYFITFCILCLLPSSMLLRHRHFGLIVNKIYFLGKFLQENARNRFSSFYSFSPKITTCMVSRVFDSYCFSALPINVTITIKPPEFPIFILLLFNYFSITFSH